MADNTVLNAGTGGDTIATDDVVGVKYQYVKLADGTADSAAVIPGSATDGLLVNLGANNDVTVAGVATAAKQDTGNTSLATLAGAVAGTEMQVDVLTMPSTAVTNAGTFAVQENGAALTSLQLIDDTVYASDAALNKTVGIGAVFDDVATVAITENQAGYLRMSSRRALLIEGVASGTVVPTSLASTTITGTVAVTKSGTWDITNAGTFAVQAAVDELPAAAAAADNFANPTTTNIMAMGMVWDGATWDRAAGTSADGALVNLGANNDVTITSGTVTTVTTVSTVTTLTGGGIAHGAADSGNPLKIGAKVETSLESVTLAADGNRSDLYADSDGVQMVKLYCPLGDVTQERVSNTDGASTAFTNFGAVASVRNYVTTIAVFNTSATDAFIDLRDGTAGSVIFTIPAPKGGGSVITFPVPLRQPTVNTALAFDPSGAITTLYISLVGFQSKV